MKWALLAPGPSLSLSMAEALRGWHVGVVGCAYQLAPWADFVASSDRAWWDKYPDAKAIASAYSLAIVQGVEKIKVPGFGICNSGVLALDVARQRGAKEIHLYGFDMHGSHFFGDYENGLTNATKQMRKRHLSEYRQWSANNKNIEVINFTPDSSIDCFAMGV